MGVGFFVDTGNPKYGRQQAFSSYFGRSGSEVYFGQKILVLVVVDLKTQEAFPISKSAVNGIVEQEIGRRGHLRAIPNS